MKLFGISKIVPFVLFVLAFSILGCAPRKVVVVEQRARPKVVVVKRPARTVVVRPAPRPHRVVVVRRR